MTINSFNDFDRALEQTRLSFNESTSKIKDEYLAPVFDLAITTFKLVGKVAKDNENERHSLEVLAVALKKVLASYSLFQSGFLAESLLPLRNALELILIAIDITYSKESLAEWKKSEDNPLDVPGNWYFKKTRVCRRIAENPDSYPVQERRLVFGDDRMKGNGLAREWDVLSSLVGHEHSQSQVKKTLKGGEVVLLAYRTMDGNVKQLTQFRVFIFNIVSVLVGIPKYHNILSSTKDKQLIAEGNFVVSRYNELQTAMNQFHGVDQSVNTDPQTVPPSI